MSVEYKSVSFFLFYSIHFKKYFAEYKPQPSHLQLSARQPITALA
jgi:hypothetical protein